MRVKTPWIDALRHSREPHRQGNHEDGTSPALSAKPDLTPKRIADNRYRAVGLGFRLPGKSG